MKYVMVLAVVLTASCSKPTSGIDSSKLVDLSYTFDEKTVYWPNAEGFRHRKDTWTKTAAGFWYAAGESLRLSMAGRIWIVRCTSAKGS